MESQPEHPTSVKAMVATVTAVAILFSGFMCARTCRRRRAPLRVAVILVYGAEPTGSPALVEAIGTRQSPLPLPSLARPAFRVIQRPRMRNLGPDLEERGCFRLEGVSLVLQL